MNATQLIGIVAFFGAALACATAAFRKREGRKVWITLAFMHLAFSIEVLVGFRHRVHNLAVSGLLADGIYGQRAEIQLPLIGLLGLVLAAVAVMILTRLRNANARQKLAVALAAALVALFTIETVSLHAIDAILYRPVGPIMLIGWIWLAACAATILTIIGA